MISNDLLTSVTLAVIDIFLFRGDRLASANVQDWGLKMLVMSSSFLSDCELSFGLVKDLCDQLREIRITLICQ